MTQADLAAAAGMSDTMISRIELGESGARFPNIQKLADALDIDPGSLFTSEAELRAGVSSAKADLAAILSGLTETDTRWITAIIEAALQRRDG